MAQIPEFRYAPMFQLGEDKTEYRLLTKEYVSVGDLYVKYLVWIPKKLKSSEKSAIESMRSSDSFTPDLSREDRNDFR